MAFPVQQVQLPHIPQVPPPLMMDDPNSFAHHTYSTRWPAVVDRIIRENHFEASVVDELRQLKRDLLHGTVRSLHDRQAPDWADWARDLSPYLGQPWIEVPWLFAEFYFYRRILEATQYFSGDAVDPFSAQKQAALEDAARGAAQPAAAVSQSLYGALWGNRADLSLNPDQNWRQDTTRSEGRTSRILVDDVDAIERYLQTQQYQGGRAKDRATGLVIDLVADNAGAELLSDLALASSLLNTYPTAQVRIHLKAYPTFVSDATLADAKQTLAAIAHSPLAAELKLHLGSGALQLKDSPLWNRPLAFWQMQTALNNILADSHLVLFKGDANYRRLVGDCQWSPETKFDSIVAYLPRSVATLRTLKSELVVGLSNEQIARLNDLDASWMTAGNWGVIQTRLD